MKCNDIAQEEQITSFELIYHGLAHTNIIVGIRHTQFYGTQFDSWHSYLDTPNLLRVLV